MTYKVGVPALAPAAQVAWVEKHVDKLVEALLSAQEYVLHLQADLADEEDFHLADGEPYHGDNCDTCRETRLLRQINAALDRRQ